MTIEQYSFNEGINIEINAASALERQCVELMKEHHNARKVLMTGAYDVTPRVWTELKIFPWQILVEVLDNGKGRLNYIPINGNEMQPKSFALPGEHTFVHLDGQDPSDMKHKIFEIISYVPGINPPSFDFLPAHQKEPVLVKETEEITTLNSSR